MYGVYAGHFNYVAIIDWDDAGRLWYCMVSEEVKMFIRFRLVMASCDGKITTSSVIMKFSRIYLDHI